MVNAIGRAGRSRDLPLVVDAVAVAGRATQRAQVLHLPVCIQKGMVLTSGCGGIARDLSRIVDAGSEGISIAKFSIATQVAQVGDAIQNVGGKRVVRINAGFLLRIGLFYPNNMKNG